MFSIIPGKDLHKVGKYFMYAPFERESYVAMFVRAEGENIFVMRVDDLPVDEVEKLYSGQEVSPSYGYSLNNAKLVTFLDGKADLFCEVSNLMAKRRRIQTAPETLNLMLDLKSHGFKSKVIVRVMTLISKEQFSELLGVWKKQPRTLKEFFKKLVGNP